MLAAQTGALAGPEPQFAVLERTNALRAQELLPPLTWSSELAQAAERYARLMAETSCFSHHCGEVDLQTRIEAAGYTNWLAVSENLAAGSSAAAEIVDLWLQSPSHRANLLSSSAQELGVGLAQGGHYGYYWVALFGARLGDPPPKSLTPATTVADPPAAPVPDDPAPGGDGGPRPDGVGAERTSLRSSFLGRSRVGRRRRSPLRRRGGLR